MDNLITIKMIETAINKGIRDIEDNPKRAIRNLVDLAKHFASSPFQKDILQLMQAMLKDLSSPYYDIVSSLVQNVDHENIKSFGINLAYNSWTYGSKKIKEYDYSIPWTIIFDFKEGRNDNLSNDKILHIIDQGKSLGIYTYMFFIDNADTILDILAKNLDCAFVLYLPPNAITEENLLKSNLYKNILFSISYEPFMNIKEFKGTIKLLKNNKSLYGLHSYYSDYNVQDILSNQWIDEIIDIESSFGILIKGKNCSDKNTSLINDYVFTSKTKQEHSVFLIDLYKDISKINSYISMQSSTFIIPNDGNAYFDNFKEGKNFDIENTSLSETFAKSKEE